MKQTNRKGLIHVYTGDGKGKTTAAIGLAVRAAGSGLYSFIGQFMKGLSYGELFSLRRLQPFVTIEQFGLKEFVHPEKPRPIDIEMARKGLNRMEKVLLGGNYDLVIFDEINVAVSFGLLKAQDVLKVIEQRPSHVEVVLTGRYAPKEFLEIADLVTEMREIKHYFSRGIEARQGIEF